MSRKRWTASDIKDQSGRVAVVTGANSGIGFETAKALADKGATVVIASRNEARGTDAVERIRGESTLGNATLKLLDLASLASIREFAESFQSEFDRLDLLINNAGVMMPPKRSETVDGFELQFGTNHLGHFALTLLLFDRLTAAPGSRVVNVSSSAQNFGELDLDDLQWTQRRFARMKSYGQSKIANMLFTLELQRRISQAGLDMMATSAHPGWTVTNLQRTSPIFRTFNPLFGMQAWQGALPTLYAAVSPDATPGGYYGPDGLGNIRGYPTPNTPAPISTDAQAANRLWSISSDLVDVPTPGPLDSPSRVT